MVLDDSKVSSLSKVGMNDEHTALNAIEKEEFRSWMPSSFNGLNEESTSTSTQPEMISDLYKSPFDQQQSSSETTTDWSTW